MKKRGIVLIACGLASLAHAADLPTTKPAEDKKAKPDCFSSLWTYLKSSVRDCPLSAGPLTLYGTLDGGVGYEQWGTRLGAYSDKANYAIQRNSGDTHWLWSPNALSTSNVGVRLSQKIGDNWEIVGAVEAGFNPYTLRLVNGPQSQADNNPYATALQRTAFDSARGGTWDNGQAFIGISNPTYGTLTFGRTTLLSMQALSAYDPVASVGFSQLGFTALYGTFGASPTSRINTAFTYRLNYQGFRVAAQAQVGGYDQFNAATQQYQAQIGTDFNGFSFDAIAGYAKNALTFASFAGAATPVGFNPYDIVRATALNTGGVELVGRYQWDKFKFYAGYIYSLSVNPSNPNFPYGVGTVAPGVLGSPRLRDRQRLHGSAQPQHGLDGSALRGLVQSGRRRRRLLGIPERLPRSARRLHRIGLGDQQHPVRGRALFILASGGLSANPPGQPLRRPSAVECPRRRRQRLSAHRELRADRRPAHSLLSPLYCGLPPMQPFMQSSGSRLSPSASPSPG